MGARRTAAPGPLPSCARLVAFRAALGFVLPPRSHAPFPTEGEGTRGSRQDCRLCGAFRELRVRIGAQEHQLVEERCRGGDQQAPRVGLSCKEFTALDGAFDAYLSFPVATPSVVSPS
ncbi:hypothetical protein H1R13_18905 [Streptomyces mexicanus]|uniref:Uncharacterized protein n=1 Tax=Streptomyces mexicanus TaxID=178566 RepID=A0A7X1LRT1_9ACTN|nr:hypothetical protein [Streptomyces mexicanus]